VLPARHVKPMAPPPPRAPRAWISRRRWPVLLFAAAFWLLHRWRRSVRARARAEAQRRRVTYAPGGDTDGSTAPAPPAAPALIHYDGDAPETARFPPVRRSAQQCWRNAVVTLPSGRVRTHRPD